MKLYNICKYVDNNFTDTTFVTNKKELKEWVSKDMYRDHYQHYLSWLNIHKLENNEENWKNYAVSVLVDDELASKTVYKVIKQRLTKKDVASIYRCLNYNYPFGCSFETDFEREYFKYIKQSEEELNKREEEYRILEENLKHKVEVFEK